MKMRLMKISDVRKMIVLSRTAIYRFIKNGEFPEQVNMRADCAAWVVGEIYDWSENKI